MTKTSNWFGRYVSGALVASVLCMYMMLGWLGYASSGPTIKANSLSGFVGIAVLDSGNNKKLTKQYPSLSKERDPVTKEYYIVEKKCYTVANIVVRVFQWHPKYGVKEDLEATAIYGVDQAKINAKFGNWHLAGETTTDKNGRYAFSKGVLTPDRATFVEVISVCRPTDPMLPTTAIIAAADMAQCKDDYKIGGIYYNRLSFYSGDKYRGLSKLTKDDRILYAFRRSLRIGSTIQTSAVPPPPSRNAGNKKRKCWVYDEESNPDPDPSFINIILDNDSEATIAPKDWYSRSSYVPIFSSERHKVGTSIGDIINFLNSEILSDSKNNKDLIKGTLIDLHYYPDVTKFCDPADVADPEYSEPFFNDDMPTEFNEYDTDVPHFYAALPPYMHLQRCAGYCYPQRFKEFLLNSELYRVGSKKEFRDLKEEADDDYEYYGINIKQNNCYELTFEDYNRAIRSKMLWNKKKRDLMKLLK